MADITDTSSRPIRLVRFVFAGRGVGTTVDVLRIRVAPFGGFATSTADGIYQTYPPVEHRSGHGCLSSHPQWFGGYLLKPRATVRALVLIRVARPGRLDSRHDVVYYRQGGAALHQSLPFGLSLRGAANARPHPLATFERPCLGVTQRLPR